MARTNYRKMSEQQPVETPAVQETLDEVVEAPVEVEVEATVASPVVEHGVVSGCERLNVRSEASTTADVLCTIDRDAEVVIVDSESTDEFYKVCTAAGIAGFCMKQFITKQ